MGVAADELLTLRQAERRFGVSRRWLSELILRRELPAQPGPRGSKRVVAADIERLIAGTGQCKCGRSIRLGQRECGPCRARRMNKTRWTDSAREAARARGRRRFPEDHPGRKDHPRRRRVGDNTRRAAENRAATFLKLKRKRKDAGEVGRELNISPKYVLQLAREHGIGQLISCGFPSPRRVFTSRDVSKLGRLLSAGKLRQKVCVDCGEPVYNRQRCPTCRSGLDELPEVAALVDRQAEATRSVDGQKNPGDLTLRETCADLQLPKSTVWNRASTRGLGRYVTDCNGRRWLLFSEQERVQLAALTPSQERRRHRMRAWHGETAEIGRASKPIAESRGKKPGGERKHDYDRIRQLRAAGAKLKDISEITGASMGSIQNALKPQ